MPTYRNIPCKILRVDEKWNWPKTYLEIEYTTRKGVTRVRWVRNSSVKTEEK